MARPSDDPDRMRHMLEAAEKALWFVKGKRRVDFDQDEMLQLALMRLVEIIGEAASRITSETRGHYSGLPWRQIIDMRHRIIHDYEHVNLGILWSTVQDDLRPLINKLKRILPAKRGREQSRRGK